MHTDQLTSYDTLGEPILADILNGYNSTLIAYGQTGSGKTYTVFGSRHSIDTIGKSGPMLDDTGVVPRLVDNLFEHIRINPNNAQFRITTSFMQIYMEQITDLLAPVPFDNRGGNTRPSSANKNLVIREDPKTGVFVHGLTLKKIRSKEELLNIIKRGARFRSTNSTTMNKTSSRSHAILQVFVEQRWVESASGNEDLSQTGVKPTKKRKHRKALMTIVDLAGSERVSKSGSEGVRLAEAKTINKTISALGNCIVALSKKKTGRPIHVPFKDNKLTRILAESLSGNSRTIICACISPSVIHFDESMSTLLFAARAMNVRIFATRQETVEYRIQKFKNHDNAYGKIKEENEELKSKIDELENKYKRHSTADPTLDTRPHDSHSDRHMIRSQSPVPNFPERYNLFTRKYSRDDNREDAKMLNIGSGSITATNYEQFYASPATKSAVSDRSWIDRNEVNQNATNEQATLLVEKLTKVIGHLQNELAKNTMIIDQLMEENRRLSSKNDSSYVRDFN